MAKLLSNIQVTMQIDPSSSEVTSCDIKTLVGTSDDASLTKEVNETWTLDGTDQTAVDVMAGKMVTQKETDEGIT